MSADESGGLAPQGQELGGSSQAAKPKQPPTETTPLVPRKRSTAHGVLLQRLKAKDEASKEFFDRFFARRDDPDFLDNLQMALRAGIVIAFFETSSMYGLAKPVVSNFLQESGLEELGSDRAVIMCIMAVSRTLGQTGFNAWSNFCGVCVGSAYAWLMFRVFPGGAFGDHDWHHASWVLGNMMGVVFIVGTLLLNLELNTKIFANNTFAPLWMLFLQPSVAHGHTYQVFRQVALQGFLDAALGCGLAILIALFPYPLKATAKATRTCRKLVQAIAKTWTLSIDFLSLASEDAYLQGDLELQYGYTWQFLHELDGHLVNASSWEAAELFKRARMPHMLRKFQSVIRESAEHLTGISLLRSTRAMTDSELAWKARLGVLLHDVSEQASFLLMELVFMACEGRQPEGSCDVETVQSERARLLAAVQDIRQSVATLKREFKAAKVAAGVPPLSEQFLDEDVITSIVASYAQITTEFAEYMTDPNFDENLPKQMNFAAYLARRFIAVFDVGAIFNPVSLRFTMRNSLVIIGCFSLGYLGYSKMLATHSAGAATSAALLLTKQSAAVIQNSLTRMQGVTLGLLAGQFLYALIGWCTIWAGLTRQILSICWLSIALYLYLDSDRFAMLGKLVALFGSQFILKRCGSNVVMPEDIVHLIVAVVLCILVMGFVNMLFYEGSPSQKAHKDMVGIWISLRSMIGGIYSLSPPTPGELLGMQQKIYAVQDVSALALNELRMGRGPWRHDIFTQATRCTFRVRSQLSVMARNIRRGDSQSAASTLLTKFVALPEFQALIEMALQATHKFPDLLEVLVVDDSTTWQEVHKPALRKDELTLKRVSEQVQLVIAAANSALSEKGDHHLFHEGAGESLSGALHSIADICRCICYFKKVVFENF